MVRVWPWAPKMMSSWATMPVMRTPWTRTPSTSAPRAPSRVCSVASGMGPRPASLRAAAMPCAVWIAVPDGASSLCGWWYSTTSAESKKRAACLAKAMASTAEIAKFGAMSTLPAPSAPHHWRTWERRSSSKPVVPTTAWMPLRMQKSRLPMTAPGVVKSTTTCAPASTSICRSSPWSTRATSSRSSAASTPSHTAEPTRPFAPSTPTLMAMVPP